MSDTNISGISIITDRYALAFMDLAEKQDMLDKFDADLSLIKETILSNKELRDFLEHPLIQIQDKKDVMMQIFSEHLNVFTLNLIRLLIDKNRIFVLVYIADHYKDLLRKKRNISTAQIITAIEIDDDIKNRVKEKLERAFSKVIEIESVVDKDIIAGMIVKIDNKVVDGSIKTKLETMKRQLI
jgi:F-type H+-transporting ATPase subunit delta